MLRLNDESCKRRKKQKAIVMTVNNVSVSAEKSDISIETKQTHRHRSI